MPKFVQEFLDNLDFDFDFNFESEIPDFPSGSEEEFLFLENIETL